MKRASPPVPPSRPKRPRARVYTAWHPMLVAMFEHILPAGWYQCISELQLSREPLRIDVVIVRRKRRGVPPAPRLVTSVLGDLAEHTIVHFKGPSDELEHDDALMLLAYALHYLVVAEIKTPAAVALRVVAPRLTPRFIQALESLGCALTPLAPLTSTEAGIHEGRLGVFALRVIETVSTNPRIGEHLLYTVTPGMVANPGAIPSLDTEESEIFWALREHVEQLRHPLPGLQRRHMKDENKVVKSFDKAMAAILARLSPEQRLAGLAPEQVLGAFAPEQVLGAFAPEQRLVGLTEAQAVLALPDAMLRALSSEYVATLPRATRAAIQKRIGQAAAPAPAPVRRRKRR